MKLPFELIIKIVEDACTDDFGKTARNVGLVSKDLRAIAEPLEFRSVAVSGIKQLEGLTARLERARAETSGDGAEKGLSRKVEVHHLFISELTEEHALVLEIPSSGPLIDDGTEMKLCGEDYWKDYLMMEDRLEHEHNYVERRKEWKDLRTKVGWEYIKLWEKWRKLDRSYRVDAKQFWSLASTLVKNSSLSLKSLSLLASDSWFEDRLAKPLDFLPKVLGCLSGVSFPNLAYLAVDHNAYWENAALRSQSPFLIPQCPQLRRLYIRSQIIVLRDRKQGFFVHPLFRDYPSTLRDVCLCGGDAFTLVMRPLFGVDWKDTAAGKRLPGNLRSLVLRLDFLPETALMGVTRFDVFKSALKEDPRMQDENIKSVTKLHVDGLEVLLPYWHSSEFRAHYPYWTWFPEEGQGHYGPMLAEMLKECRESA